MIKKAKSFARDITLDRYPQCDTRKIGKKLYVGDIESTWVAGLLTTVDEIHKQHAKQPYESAEILLGDLQVWAETTFNYFNAKHANGKLKRVRVDDFIKEGKLVIK